MPKLKSVKTGQKHIKKENDMYKHILLKYFDALCDIVLESGDMETYKALQELYLKEVYGDGQKGK